MHFIFDLIRKILLAQRGGPPAVLWGDGHQRRELVYILDFVRAAVLLAGSAEDCLINVGAGEEFSIREFAQLICDLVEFDFDLVQFDPTKYVGAKSKCLSVAKLHRYLPDLELTPLSAGLAQTIRWFAANPHLIDAPEKVMAA